MSEQRFRTSYDAPRRVYSPHGVESLTEQNHARECDINVIMAKYAKTGVIDHVNDFQAQYGDASSVDFTEAMQLVANAQSMFQELPARARAHFDHDPAQFLHYMESLEEGDDAAGALLSELGLAEPGFVPKPPEDPREEPTEAPAGSEDASQDP